MKWSAKQTKVCNDFRGNSSLLINLNSPNIRSGIWRRSLIFISWFEDDLSMWWVAIPFEVDIEPWCCFISLYITKSEYITGLQVDLKSFLKSVFRKENTCNYSNHFYRHLKKVKLTLKSLISNRMKEAPNVLARTVLCNCIRQ